MQCEICEVNEATLHFKQVLNGEVREMHICTGCAAEHGFEVQTPMGMTDFLFGIGVQPEAGLAQAERRCPACNFSGADFKKEQRLGCAACYETFADELSPLLAAMHKGGRHVGKVPARERMSSEILSLQRALENAVSAQDFEEAAVLRDRIQVLKHDPAEPSNESSSHEA